MGGPVLTEIDGLRQMISIRAMESHCLRPHRQRAGCRNGQIPTGEMLVYPREREPY
jgi:hypothetical protein